MSLETSSSASRSASTLKNDEASVAVTGGDAGMISSLGDALAGVSLGFHTPTATSGASSTATGNGWGGFSNPEASRNSFARSNNNNGGNDARDDRAVTSGSNTTSHVEPSTPDALERKQSIDLFLSRSPSQMLGNDVFKLSTGNLPGLVIPEDSTATTTPSMGAAMSQPSVGVPSPPGAYDSAVKQRRGSPASNITGVTTSTTTASRSNSPYESGGVGVSGGRTIQAYHPASPYDHQQHTEGANGSATAYHPITPGLVSQSYHDPGTASSNHLQDISTQLLHSPYSGGNTIGFGGTNQYDAFPAASKPPQSEMAAQQQQQQQQQQPQILYMAVPTPDGRGQVLQPVQIMQMPGKQFAYVLPGADGISTTMQGTGQPMMVMPTMMSPQQQQQQPGQMSSPIQPIIQGQVNNMMVGGVAGRAPGQVKASILGGFGSNLSDGTSYASPMAGDKYGTDVGLGGDNAQFLNQPTDPALASLYSTPQRPPLDALLGQVRRLSRDQVGCRLVQQALDEEGPMAATLILNEGLPFWGEAMVDPFGNYLFQKILEKITVEERIMLIKSVSTRLVNASLNLHGTRSVQKIVELCAIDEENKKKELPVDNTNSTNEETAADVLTNALAPAAARLCIDSHGNHVIQRILLKLGHKHSKFIFDAVAESVGDVARHRHGCCVIQRCLDSQPGPARAYLVRRIVEKSLELMQDAYGNYVVQYVLDVCSDDDVHAVCESVVGKVNLLAIQKFSSNVMEKCLERCTDRVKEQYLQELSDTDRVRELMMDPFGNYVVQRALSVATHAQAVRLVEAMRPHLIAQAPGTPNGQRNGGVRNTAGGRRIMAKICRRFPNFNLNETESRDDLYSQNRRHHPHGQHNQSPGMAPMYGMAQLAPTPVQILHHQPPMQSHIQQQHQQYSANPNHHDYRNTNSLSMNALNMSNFQMDHQRQQYYDLGNDGGYFQQTPHFGQGTYPGGL
ncbi:Pumilio-family RNA binding repeat protein [Nitzschia inconspicua]|uniref:Pumilio-family RNA binding repeat protein n=1 Tax=Nitzschia inconspicua TaxID=303405 RepID=A0A9K3PX59_9STRA|nr:Pumilio-family RNA binding repeat protein [Nitzschia inconspicua]